MSGYETIFVGPGPGGCAQCYATPCVCPKPDLAKEAAEYMAKKGRKAPHPTPEPPERQQDIAPDLRDVIVNDLRDAGLAMVDMARLRAENAALRKELEEARAACTVTYEWLSKVKRFNDSQQDENEFVDEIVFRLARALGRMADWEHHDLPDELLARALGEPASKEEDR